MSGTAADPLLRVRIEGKSYGATPALRPIAFDLGATEIVALVGPSGCGKSTLLRIVGGLDTAFQGRMAWHGGRTPRIGTVFQEPRLLPWRTVWDNLALVLDDSRHDAAAALLNDLGLAAQRDAWPRTLSLGMARRVAIARAFAVDPALVLLDEPFASLDPATAERSREVLLAAWRRRPRAMLLVTHDLAEAASLADRILFLSAGPAQLVGDITVPGDVRRQGIETGARTIETLRGEGRLGVIPP